MSPAEAKRVAQKERLSDTQGIMLGAILVQLSELQRSIDSLAAELRPSKPPLTPPKIPAETTRSAGASSKRPKRR